MKNKHLFDFGISLGFILFITALLIFLFYYFCISMPGTSFSGPQPPPNEELQALSERLSEHVSILAGQIGERNYIQRPNLEKAADYIEEQFHLAKLVPKSQLINDNRFRNIVVDTYSKQRRDEIFVAGAHYDTTTQIPGADDNASGVAGLLELARLIRDKKLPVTIRFIAFVSNLVSRPLLTRAYLRFGKQQNSHLKD